NHKTIYVYRSEHGKTGFLRKEYLEETTQPTPPPKPQPSKQTTNNKIKFYSLNLLCNIYKIKNKYN
ncbi:hypothetical protein Q0O86_14000, partial [Staphylococcus aureus]|nr:hypothetical protein [Staphylococcus aureus]